MAGSVVAFGSTPPARKAVLLPPVIVTATPVAATKSEPHPEIREAVRALEEAKHHLERAGTEFGGHRLKAMGDIDGALDHLHMAMRFAR